MSWMNVLRKADASLYQGNQVNELRRKVREKKKEIQSATHIHTKRKLIAQLQPLLQQLRTADVQQTKRGQFGNFMDKVRRDQNLVSQRKMPQQPTQPQPTQPTQPQTQQIVPLPPKQPQITNVGGGQVGTENPLPMKKPTQTQTLSPEQQASIRLQINRMRKLMESSKNLPDGKKAFNQYRNEVKTLEDRLKSSGIPA